MSTPAQATIIASHTFIKGEVQLSGPSTIAGRIEGAVTSQDQIDVTTEAYIEGDVQAAVIEINGSIKGNILATRSCRLGPTAKAAGELRAANLSIAEGACFVGQVSVGSIETSPAETHVQTMQTMATESMTNRLDALAADSRELAEMAAAPMVRISTEAVQKAVQRGPQIIRPRA
ncbi:MAG: polymer-forming cytoskeletal protein [Phycisphaerales bacterium]|nr:polymer-forming cytoskeletal protein [Phycisphaerales bacterium]